MPNRTIRIDVDQLMAAERKNYMLRTRLFGDVPADVEKEERESLAVGCSPYAGEAARLRATSKTAVMTMATTYAKKRGII